MTGKADIDCKAERVERDAWLDLFDAVPADVRDELGLASARVAGMGLLGCRSIPITELNRAMAVGLDRPLSRADLDTAVAWLDANATTWALQVAPMAEVIDRQDDLARARLVATGPGWAKFVGVDVAPPSTPPEVTVEIVDSASAAVFGRTVAQGFGLPPACATWFAALPPRQAWRCFLAFVDGTPAGGGALFVRDGAAWMGIEATLPDHRGRGVQRSVIAAQLAAAAALGAAIYTCETAQPPDRDAPGFSSYRNQERAGLSRAYARPNFKRAD